MVRDRPLPRPQHRTRIRIPRNTMLTFRPNTPYPSATPQPRVVPGRKLPRPRRRQGRDELANLPEHVRIRPVLLRTDPAAARLTSILLAVACPSRHHWPHPGPNRTGTPGENQKIIRELIRASGQEWSLTGRGITDEWFSTRAAPSAQVGPASYAESSA